MNLKSHVNCDLCGKEITMPKAIIEYVDGHVYIRHQECRTSKVSKGYSVLNIENETHQDTNCIMNYLNQICNRNPQSAPACAKLIVKIFE